MKIRSALIHIVNKVLSISMIFAIAFAVGTEMALKYHRRPWALWIGVAVLFCACGKFLMGPFCKRIEGTRPKKRSEGDL